MSNILCIRLICRLPLLDSASCLVTFRAAAIARETLAADHSFCAGACGSSNDHPCCGWRTSLLLKMHCGTCCSMTCAGRTSEYTMLTVLATPDTMLLKVVTMDARKFALTQMEVIFVVTNRRNWEFVKFTQLLHVCC